MLQGKCHCGEVRWTLDHLPRSVTACNCTVCRRYGALWAYGFIGYDIHLTGRTKTYRRGEDGDIDFHFCARCGCVALYVASCENEDGDRQAAVNLRMCDPSRIHELPIRHFDGCDSFTEQPPDGRKVKDM